MPDQKKRKTRTTPPSLRSTRVQAAPDQAGSAVPEPVGSPELETAPAAAVAASAPKARKSTGAVKAAAKRVVARAAAPSAPKTGASRKKATVAEPPVAGPSASPEVQAAVAAPGKRAAAPRRRAAAPVAPAVPPPAPLSILIVASEAAPFARTGEVGDIAAGLPAALGSLGHRVTLVAPKYGGVATAAAAVDRFPVRFDGHEEEAACFEVSLGANARAILVEHAGFFDREHVYGDGDLDYADNPRRFAFLCRAALEFAAREGERIDVLVANDWQTGLVPVFLRTEFAGAPALAEASSLFLIHDIAYQGLCAPEWLGMLGIDPALFGVGGLEYWGQVSLLKGGINFADLVATVRPGYGRQLVSGERCSGFEGILAARGDAFVSVLADGDRAADQPALAWDWAEAGPRFAECLAAAKARRAVAAATVTA
jgi:starch synthase